MLTSTIATSRPTYVDGLASTRSFRRSPNDLDFDMRSIWHSTRAGSRSGSRPRGFGKAPTVAASRVSCARRSRPTGPSQGWLVPWRLAATMKNDHVAALVVVHWPSPVAPWYLDLRRAAAYSPVLGRWTTLNDFFHLTDRPYETFRPEPDSYQSPYLAQAAARRDREPIGRMARHHRLRVAMGSDAGEPGSRPGDHVVGGQRGDRLDLPAEGPALEEIENLIETGRHAEAADRAGPRRARSVGGAGAGDRGTAAPSATGKHARPGAGYLVINPLNVPRRAAVILPDAALDLRPDGPLRAAQFTDQGVWAVVDLPAFGFAWVPREADASRPPASAAGLSTRGRTAQERVDRDRNRHRHGGPSQCRRRGRAVGAVWPATGHDGIV